MFFYPIVFFTILYYPCSSVAKDIRHFFTYKSGERKYLVATSNARL
jgi:hypothetical protein